MKKYLWIFPSIGNSPVKKYIEGVGADLLRFKMVLSVFCSNRAKGSKDEDLRVKDDRPDLRIGLV